MRNRDFIIEQYRGGTLVRTFSPSGDTTYPWAMTANGKTYLRTNGWVLSKVLPTLVEDSAFTTRAVPIGGTGEGVEADETAGPADQPHPLEGRQ